MIIVFLNSEPDNRQKAIIYQVFLFYNIGMVIAFKIWQNKLVRQIQTKRLFYCKIK